MILKPSVTPPSAYADHLLELFEQALIDNPEELEQGSALARLVDWLLHDARRYRDDRRLCLDLLIAFAEARLARHYDHLDQETP